MSIERLSSSPVDRQETEKNLGEAVTRLGDLIPKGVKFADDNESEAVEGLAEQMAGNAGASTVEEVEGVDYGFDEDAPKFEKIRKSGDNIRQRDWRVREKELMERELARRRYGEVRSLNGKVGPYQGRRELNGLRSQEAEKYLYEKQVQEFLSFPKTFAEIAGERDKLIDEHGETYLKIGTEIVLADGVLESFPEHAIVEGFSAVEGKVFEDAFDLSDRMAEYGEFQIDLRAKADDYIGTLSKLSEGGERVNQVERDAVEAAIYRGVFAKADGYADQRGVRYSVPVNNPGFVEYLERHQLDPAANDELRRLSMHGFGQVVGDLGRSVSSEATLDLTTEEVAEIKQAGMSQLDGYYRVFNYADNKDEFLNYMLARREGASEEWREVFQEWLGTHPELGEGDDLENEDLRRVSEVTKVGREELEAKLRELKEKLGASEDAELSFGPGRRETAEEVEAKKGGRNVLTEFEKYNYSLAKIEGFERHARKIREEIDPYADFYIEKFEGEQKDSDRMPFLAVRYGDKNTGTNNLIAEDTSPIGAMYVWSGKEHGDAWREIFRGSRGDALARDDVARVNHYGMSKDAPQTVDQAWVRALAKASKLAKAANEAENEAA